jgi:sulfite exporter TauE/SafE
VTLTWLVPMVSAGVLGSVHCIGMCGGLIAAASDGASEPRQRFVVQAGYQAARLLSYVALGGVAGGLGHALDLAGQAAGLGKAAAVIAGTTMSVWGLLGMLEATGALKRALPGFRLLPRRVVAWLAGVRQRPPLARAMLLGGVSALLPCGFLYAFALAGAATGSPLGGMLVMAALWLGNLPALLGFGLLLASALSRVKRHVPLLSATSVLVLGLYTLNSRVNVPAFALASATGGAIAKAPGAGEAPMPADCPLHGKGTKHER